MQTRPALLYHLIGLFFAATVITSTPLSIVAQEDTNAQPLRPTLSAYTLEVGSANIADTYLSPLKYNGLSFAFNYERMQAMRFNPERWVMQLKGRLDIDRTLNTAKNGTMWNIGINVGWGMMHRWKLSQRWSLYAGGSTGLNGGAVANLRNGNNPVSARAAWTVNATAMATLNTHISSLPICIRYQAELPLTGCFFSQDYGELYYEIYLGNHSNLVHIAWPGNYFGLNNILSVDLRFGGTTLRLGYNNYIRSTNVCNITTRRITNTFVIGIASEWLSLSAKRDKLSKADTRIISSMY